MYGSIKDDFRNAFNRPNSAHTQLIIINVAIFFTLGVFQLISDFSLGRNAIDVTRDFFGMSADIPTLITRFWTPITYMFVHDGFWHILMNMLFLYWFGKILTEYAGSDKIIKLYVVGGLFGAAFYLTLFPIFLNLLNPGIDNDLSLTNLVGASAGVFAIVVGTATLLPNYTIYLMFIGPVKIKYIALFYLASFILRLSGPNSGGELAHLGGAFAGYLYISQLQKGSDWGQWVISTMNFFKSFFVRSPKIKVTHRKASQQRSSSFGTASKSNKPSTSQEEIDAILDKISEKGYESLTTEEKQKLFNASK